MDTKYGQLYTEEDVKRIVDHMADGDADREDYRHRLQEALGATGPFQTFPGDEPTFLLRAKDDMAGSGLWGYHEGCLDEAGPEHVAKVEQAIEQFERFRLDHPDRMRVPD